MWWSVYCNTFWTIFNEALTENRVVTCSQCASRSSKIIVQLQIELLCNFMERNPAKFYSHNLVVVTISFLILPPHIINVFLTFSAGLIEKQINPIVLNSSHRRGYIFRCRCITKARTSSSSSSSNSIKMTAQEERVRFG